MIREEPTNTAPDADARLVARYIRRGITPGDAEQLAMLFADPDYRAHVYRLAYSQINDRAKTA